MPKGMLRMHLHNRVAFHREVAGLTQARLASLVGVAPTTIARWETDETVPSERTMLVLAEVLRVRPGDLFPRDYL